MIRYNAVWSRKGKKDINVVVISTHFSFNGPYGGTVYAVALYKGGGDASEPRVRGQHLVIPVYELVYLSDTSTGENVVREYAE